MKRFVSSFKILCLSLLIFSCSPEEPEIPRHLIHGVWKPVAIQHLDSSGEVVGMEKAKENPCLDASRWIFSEQLLSFYTLSETSTGRCRLMKKREKACGYREGIPIFSSTWGGSTGAEEVDIIHVSKERLILKLHGTWFRDAPEIMIFQKEGEEFDPITIPF